MVIRPSLSCLSSISAALVAMAPLAGAPGPAAAQPESPPTTANSFSDDWRGTLELYGFLPELQSTTIVAGLNAETNLSPRQILNTLQSSFTARGSVEKNRLGLLLDIAYNQLGSESSYTPPDSRLTGAARVNAISGFYDLAVRWRLGDLESAVAQPGDGWIIPYAGARLVQTQLAVAAQIRRQPPLAFSYEPEGTLERSWVQSLVGVQSSVFVSPRLRLFARGDIAGFGLSGAQDLSANAQAGVGYAVGNNTDLNLSWRYQMLRFNNGGNPANGYLSDQSGVELGLKFYF